MTDLLKQILHQYGLLDVTISQLTDERPSPSMETIEEYDKKLWSRRIEEDEPLVFVRIGPDGEHKIIEKGNHDLVMRLEDGRETEDITVIEMPEDDFYYFGAFRAGIYDLKRELPAFIHELGLVHAYALFENYLTEVIGIHLGCYPELMGSDKSLKYSEVFCSSSKNELVEKLVQKEVREIMYLPIVGILAMMRNRFGFQKLSSAYDKRITRLSLIRNCLMHNRGKVDQKLAQAYPDSYKSGVSLEITEITLKEAIQTLKKFVYEVDQIFEKIGNA